LAALGFLLAWRIDSVQGFHGVANLFLIPLWLLSGALFPSTGASDWVQTVMTFNPLTYCVALLHRALYLAPTAGATAGPSLAASFGVTLAFAVTAGLAAFAAARRPARGDGE
jgi:ABC-2 type transport system permease protein